MSKVMAIQQAQRKAKRLFDKNAQAEPYAKDYVQILLGEPAATWTGWPPRTLLGWGKTWEEDKLNGKAYPL